MCINNTRANYNNSDTTNHTNGGRSFRQSTWDKWGFERKDKRSKATVRTYWKAGLWGFEGQCISLVWGILGSKKGGNIMYIPTKTTTFCFRFLKAVILVKFRKWLKTQMIPFMHWTIYLNILVNWLNRKYWSLFHADSQYRQHALVELCQAKLKIG